MSKQEEVYNETEKSWTCDCGSLNASWLCTCGGCDITNQVDTSSEPNQFGINVEDDTVVKFANSAIWNTVYAGVYNIGPKSSTTTSFSLENKPNFINRWFCKWCLGWEWVDN